MTSRKGRTRNNTDPTMRREKEMKLEGSSLITEEMRSMLGVEVGPEVHEIEKGMIKKFATALDDPNPLWQDEAYAQRTKYGGIIAPPTFTMCLCHLKEQEEWVKSLNGSLSKMLNVGMEIENYQVVKAGDIIYVTGKLIELYKQESKKIGKMVLFVFECIYKNQRGEVVTKGRLTFIKY